MNVGMHDVTTWGIGIFYASSVESDVVILLLKVSFLLLKNPLLRNWKKVVLLLFCLCSRNPLLRKLKVMKMETESKTSTAGGAVTVDNKVL